MKNDDTKESGSFLWNTDFIKGIQKDQSPSDDLPDRRMYIEGLSH